MAAPQQIPAEDNLALDQIPRNVSEGKYIRFLAAAVLLFIAAASGFAAYWVMEYRTEAGLQTEVVETARASQGQAEAAKLIGMPFGTSVSTSRA